MLNIEAVNIEDILALFEFYGFFPFYKIMSYWQEVLERGQVQTDDIPAFWFATPVWDSVVHRD